MQLLRGSLKQCIAAAISAFSTMRFPTLSILAHPRGKYYSLCDDSELEQRKADDPTDSARLLFRGTFRELRTFLNTPQADLFPEDNPDAPPPDLESQ